MTEYEITISGYESGLPVDTVEEVIAEIIPDCEVEAVEAQDRRVGVDEGIHGAEIDVDGVPSELSPYIDMTDEVESNPRLVFNMDVDSVLTQEHQGSGMMKITAELPTEHPVVDDE